jgi:hypothetical protein
MAKNRKSNSQPTAGIFIACMISGPTRTAGAVGQTRPFGTARAYRKTSWYGVDLAIPLSSELPYEPRGASPCKRCRPSRTRRGRRSPRARALRNTAPSTPQVIRIPHPRTRRFPLRRSWQDHRSQSASSRSS